MPHPHSVILSLENTFFRSTRSVYYRGVILLAVGDTMSLSILDPLDPLIQLVSAFLSIFFCFLFFIIFFKVALFVIF